MIKYNFLLFHKEHESFLERLASLGVIDVTINNWQPSDAEQQVIAKTATYGTVIERLKYIKNSNSKRGIEIKDSARGFSSDKVIELYQESTLKIEQLSAKLVKLRKEEQDATIWGEYSHEMVSLLAAEGVFLRFFTSSHKEFAAIAANENYHTEVINDEGAFVLFAVICRTDGEHLDFGQAGELKLPQATLSDKRAEIKTVEAGLQNYRDQINECTLYIGLLHGEKEMLDESLSFSKIYNSNKIEAEGSVVVIEGWAPKEHITNIDNEFASDNALIVIKEEATEQDSPPVLLRNKRFGRMAEIITKLYSLPNYHSLDLTSYFAPCFVFFVGICFADIAYGMFTFLIGYFFWRKTKIDSQKLIYELVMWCSVSAILMGVVTGNFGGIELVNIKLFAPVKSYFLGQTDMFSFAIGVGILQILYGMFLKAYGRAKRYGFAYCLSTLGWAFTIVASLLAYLLPTMGINFSFDSIAYKIIVIAGVGAAVFLHNPKANFFMSAGAGLWEFYNSLTGLLGDTLSYARLFALGLSGGIIAGVFNDLAVGMSGDIPILKYVFMLMILVVGHGINLFMSAIGSFVHPLRLTFVEFYNNAGFESGGKEYRPFKRKSKNKE